MNLFCLGMPAVFAVWVYKKIMKNGSTADLIIHYGIFAFVINVICFLICLCLSGTSYVLNFEFTPLSFILKYLTLAIFISLLVSVIYCLISRKFDLQIEIVHHKKEGRKNEK